MLSFINMKIHLGLVICIVDVISRFYSMIMCFVILIRGCSQIIYMYNEPICALLIKQDSVEYIYINIDTRNGMLF